MISGTAEAGGRRPGMRTFIAIWLGQLVSVLGSAMTQFALLIWVWQETGQATAIALMGFFVFAPQLMMLPIAGALVDRWNRKLTMMLSDLAAGLGTVAILILYLTGLLEVWHLYAIGVFVGIFGSFQWPAYSSAITLMVEKRHYARASGLVGLVGSISGIFGPPMAAALLVFIGISGIFMLDIATFCIAIGVLLVSRIPQPPPADDVQRGIRGVFKDAGYGFRYIYRRKPLFGLQMTFFTFNLISVFGITMLNPMVLARTGSDKIILASVQSMLSIGAVVGGVILALWGGPRKKVNGLLGGMMLSAFLFAVGFGIGQTPVLWMLFGFLSMLIVPTVNGSSQAIWQSKVPAERQGRVFAARGFIAQGASALAMVIVGPLADYYFEPAMEHGGSLAPTFGWLVGTGPGAGMGLMILLSSLACVLVAFAAYNIRFIREVERIVPDADPRSRLARYRRRLARACREGRISMSQCRELYLRKRKELGLQDTAK